MLRAAVLIDIVNGERPPLPQDSDRKPHTRPAQAKWPEEARVAAMEAAAPLGAQFSVVTVWQIVTDILDAAAPHITGLHDQTGQAFSLKV